MIQYRAHGMMKSTDFSVCRISPLSPRIRSRGTMMWMPLEASTFSPPSAWARSWVCSVQTPVAAMTVFARTVCSAPVSRSRTVAPTTRPVSSVGKDTARVRLAASAP